MHDTIQPSETTLDAIRNQINSIHERAACTRSQLRSIADNAFGEVGEELRGTGEAPMRAGKCGSVVDALDNLSRTIDELGAQAGRFQFLA